VLEGKRRKDSSLDGKGIDLFGLDDTTTCTVDDKDDDVEAVFVFPRLSFS